MFKWIFCLFVLMAPFALAGLPPTATKGSSDSNFLTTFNFSFPNQPITHTGTTATLGILLPNGGGLGLAAPSSTGGQLPISTSGGGYSLSRLTAGTNIAINNASGAITITGVIPQISLATGVSGTLSLISGGTNANLTANPGGVLYSSGAALEISAAGTAGQPFISSGISTPPGFGKLDVSSATNIVGIVSAPNGGTGQSSYAIGDILYATGTNNLSKLAIGSSGQSLSVVNGLPAWSNATANVLSPSIVSINSASTPPTTAGAIYADASGGSFTVTIPTAASMANQILYIEKSDTTVKVVSTAGGFTKPLITPTESYLLQSNGTVFNVLMHKASWKFNPETISVTAVTTDPNKGATSLVDKISCERMGRRLVCDMAYYSTSTGTNGSGIYGLKLINAVSGAGIIDSARMPAYTSAASVAEAVAAMPAGTGCLLSNNGTFDYNARFHNFNGTTIRLISPANNAYWQSSTNGFAGSVYLGCKLSMPMTTPGGTEWDD